MRTPNAAVLAAVLVALLAALAGCGTSERTSHNVDTIRLTPEQERDVFVASGNLGPDTNVIVLATVPKARYENGAIVLTGGREMHIVQPHAWRAYTGTAISTEEAARMIARAERSETAIRDVGAAASDLRIYLESRSSEAKAEAERMRKKDEAWRTDQERQTQKMLTEAARLRRSRDLEISRITSERDERISALYKEGTAEIQGITDAFGREVAAINERYARLTATEASAYNEKAEKLTQSQKAVTAIAEGKQSPADYLRKLAETQEHERQVLSQEHARAAAKIQADRDNEIAKLRSETARKVDDARRLYEEKAERLRREAETAIAEVRALQASDAVQLPPSAAGPAAPAPLPAEAPPASSAPAPGPAPTPADGGAHGK